jgi:hypothetical protein
LPATDHRGKVRKPFVGARTIPAFLLALLAVPSLTMAAEGRAEKPEIPRLGLEPGEPQVRSATPTIPFGIRPAESRQLVLDFHGYLLLPAYLGVHQRESPQPGQSSTVLHSPPLMAQDLRRFEYTGVMPSPWLQLNFLYGNSTVYATAILVGQSAMDAAGYHNVVEQMGVNDAFITANLTKTFGFPFQLEVGAMTGRYGAMGAWDAGRYGTPLIARTNSIGERITAGLTLGKFQLVIEQGLGGQLNRPPVDIVPAGWNDFADGNVGSTFVNHVHLGALYADLLKLGLHYLTAWTQDDLANGGQLPNGRITVLGADLHVTAKRAGHLYLGGSWTKATNAGTVSGAIEILNARGGPELVENYLGASSGGNGSLSTFGAQYDVSIARLVFGDLYQGESPDVLVSLFGVGTKVKSNDPSCDGVLKMKGGAEATYLPLSWFGVSERLDHVRLHGDDSKQAFTIWSSRLLFHPGWKSRGQLALQYSHFVYGSSVYVKAGYPPQIDPTVNPDKDVFSLTGTYWW